jgi:hypothetical protein
LIEQSDTLQSLFVESSVAPAFSVFELVLNPVGACVDLGCVDELRDIQVMLTPDSLYDLVDLGFVNLA